MNKKIILSALFFVLSSSAVLASDHNGFLTADNAPDSFQIRRELAAKDSDYKTISAAFSDSFGEEISPENTPALYKLLLWVLQDSHDYAMRGALHASKTICLIQGQHLHP
ncbi:hypothetical protein [Enterobacter cancerogenus]|uniref:hypothetical protein n=1 Tax=Enterobacter cancerogenus TaxID=69218 RepID=UPI002360D522|nr:hypothetical protein [Enterobacter cancerogenus]